MNFAAFSQFPKETQRQAVPTPSSAVTSPSVTKAGVPRTPRAGSIHLCLPGSAELRG